MSGLTYSFCTYCSTSKSKALALQKILESLKGKKILEAIPLVVISKYVMNRDFLAIIDLKDLILIRRPYMALTIAHSSRESSNRSNATIQKVGIRSKHLKGTKRGKLKWQTHYTRGTGLKPLFQGQYCPSLLLPSPYLELIKNYVLNWGQDAPNYMRMRTLRIHTVPALKFFPSLEFWGWESVWKSWRGIFSPRVISF